MEAPSYGHISINHSVISWATTRRIVVRCTKTSHGTIRCRNGSPGDAEYVRRDLSSGGTAAAALSQVKCMPALRAPESKVECADVRSPLPDLRGFASERAERGARRCTACGARCARARRFRGAARRPPAERVPAGERGASGLAHRLHRLRRRGGRAGGPRGAVRRRALHGAGGRPGRRQHLQPSSICGEPARPRWLEQNLGAGAKLGYDPWLHTSDGAERLRSACATVGAELVAVDDNPIDALWRDRPAPPAGRVALHDIKFAGERAADKLARVRAELGKLHADALVVSDPQNVAWAFQYPRLRYRAYAAGAGQCLHPARGAALALCRAGQARQ